MQSFFFNKPVYFIQQIGETLDLVDDHLAVWPECPQFVCKKTRTDQQPLVNLLRQEVDNVCFRKSVAEPGALA